MQRQDTETLQANSVGISRASSLLLAGKLVAFPTETVYGLGGDATNHQAIERIFLAKARPSFNPLIVHVSSLEEAQKIGKFDQLTEKLAEILWPGPLTLVLPLRANSKIAPSATSGLDSVALRVPAHNVAQTLLRAVDRPIAAPSANRSGQISATRSAHVFEDLEGRIAAVLDDGPVAHGIESTVLTTINGFRLLRFGSVTPEQIAQIVGEMPRPDATPALKQAPGQMVSHYAPNALLEMNVKTPPPNTVHIGFGDEICALNLSPTGDLSEAAARLFDLMRQADKLAGGEEKITVSPIPMQGLGFAINDRLKRAAAPKMHK